MDYQIFTFLSSFSWFYLAMLSNLYLTLSENVYFVCLFISYLFPIYFDQPLYRLQSDGRVLFIITAAVTTLASLVAHLKQGQELVTIILKLLWTKYFVKNVIKP